MKCAVCERSMANDLLAGTFRCVSCGFFSSNFDVSINSGSRLDEDARARALKPIRLANFEQLLNEIACIAPVGRLLDVGCAHGWFIQAAKIRGYNGTGIEPDTAIAAVARKSSIDVIEGYFPEALPPDAKYDLITFNDVFEHLPDINGMAQSIRLRLAPNGVVVINLPVSDGAIFQLSRIAARLGVTSPLARMWQLGLPSPHLSYFSKSTLPKLMESHGFQLLQSGPLTSMNAKGLFERIRYDRSMSVAEAVAIYSAARIIGLGSKIFPSDIQFFAFRVSCE